MAYGITSANMYCVCHGKREAEGQRQKGMSIEAYAEVSSHETEQPYTALSVPRIVLNSTSPETGDAAAAQATGPIHLGLLELISIGNKITWLFSSETVSCPAQNSSL